MRISLLSLAHLRLHTLLGLALLGVTAVANGASNEHFNNYKLQPMDLVRVQVFQEPDLDRELRVPTDGNIDLPLIGRVNVKNRSIREVQSDLTALYQKDFLVNPQVNVSVLEYVSRNVNVLGAVNSPGSVTMPPETDLSLLDAIARSGGFSRLANRTKVSLSRTQPDGRTKTITLNADQILSGEATDRWTLVSGDVVYVPERIL